MAVMPLRIMVCRVLNAGIGTLSCCLLLLGLTGTTANILKMMGRCRFILLLGGWSLRCTSPLAAVNRSLLGKLCAAWLNLFWGGLHLASLQKCRAVLVTAPKVLRKSDALVFQKNYKRHEENNSPELFVIVLVGVYYERRFS